MKQKTNEEWDRKWKQTTTGIKNYVKDESPWHNGWSTAEKAAYKAKRIKEIKERIMDSIEIDINLRDNNTDPETATVTIRNLDGRIPNPDLIKVKGPNKAKGWIDNLVVHGCDLDEVRVNHTKAYEVRVNSSEVDYIDIEDTIVKSTIEIDNVTAGVIELYKVRTKSDVRLSESDVNSVTLQGVKMNYDLWMSDVSMNRLFLNTADINKLQLHSNVRSVEFVDDTERKLKKLLVDGETLATKIDNLTRENSADSSGLSGSDG